MEQTEGWEWDDSDFFHLLLYHPMQLNQGWFNYKSVIAATTGHSPQSFVLLENLIAVAEIWCIPENLWDCGPHSGWRRERLHSVFFTCSTWTSWRIAVACGKKLFLSCYLTLVSGSSTFSCLSYGNPFSPESTLQISSSDLSDSILDWPLWSWTPKVLGVWGGPCLMEASQCCYSL